MIEIVEETTSAGTNATVVGGNRVVKIVAQAAKYHPARRSTSDNKMIKSYTSPAGFWVKHDAGTKFITEYDRAVSLAVYHAKRA